MEVVGQAGKGLSHQYSEQEFHRQLNHAPPFFLCRVAEQRRVDLPGGAVEPKGQVRAAREGPQRVVQEVVSVEPELQLLRLR